MINGLCGPESDRAGTINLSTAGGVRSLAASVQGNKANYSVPAPVVVDELRNKNVMLFIYAVMTAFVGKEVD